ncbi:MAG: hypothetical protein E6H07_12895 [Bacteroidetes bacterium]|nr:MAG: hypothetical protein E6H07_12895 [Bacteroidota bacterium]
MNEYPELDETWTVFTNFSANPNKFAKEFIPDLYLKPSVHKDVRENFKVIGKLLEHSYYVYKFYDVAVLKSLLTLEMALKVRYKNQFSDDWGKRSLKSLMALLKKANYFEVYNKDFLHRIREIRNMLAHPTQHTVSGPNGKIIIENVVDLINGLYESPALRLKRMNLTSKIINQLHRYKNGVKCTIGNTSYFAISAWPAFINNKSTPQEIHFYFHPTFSIPETSTNWLIPQTIHFIGRSIRFTAEGISMKNDSYETLLISEISDTGEKAAYDNWMNSYETYIYPKLGYSTTIDEKIVDTFSLHLKEFHKLN